MHYKKESSFCIVTTVSGLTADEKGIVSFASEL